MTKQLTLVLARQLPPGWSEFRKRVISKSTNAHIERKNRANG